MKKKRSAGRWGEDLALEYLEDRGLVLVERNYRTRRGEIDLIFRDGPTLVFVEVKLRSGPAYGDPLEAVTPRKRAAIRALAEQYLAERTLDPDDVRFDAVGIVLDKGAPELRHVKYAF